MISLGNLFFCAPTGLKNPRQKWRLAVYVINNHAHLKNPVLWEARHAILLKYDHGACVYLPFETSPVNLKQPVSKVGSIMLGEMIAIKIVLDFILEKLHQKRKLKAAHSVT